MADHASHEEDGKDVLLADSCVGQGHFRLTQPVDPAANGRNLLPVQRRVSRRHGSRDHLVQQQAPVRRPGDDGRTRFATLQNRSGGSQVQLGLGRGLAVAGHALVLDDGQDRGFENVRFAVSPVAETGAKNKGASQMSRRQTLRKAKTFPELHVIE